MHTMSNVNVDLHSASSLN